MPPELYVAALLLLVWTGLMILIARVTGWALLAKAYPLPRPFRGDRWRFQSASMRYKTNYGLCLTVGANPEGFYLAILFPFRPGHPPLFIPWTDISAAVKPSRMFPYRQIGLRFVELRFQRVPEVPLRIMERLGRRLARSADPAWPGPKDERRYV